MEIATQLALFLANKPGTLAAVCDALAAENINIYGLTISDTVDHAVVRMVVSDHKKALSIFEEHGTLVVENEVLMIVQDNRPGTLSGLAKKLAGAGINIEYAYLANTPDSPKGLLIFRPNDIKKAFDVLSRS
ncbi:MAG TPA: ACT domain-containing protein [Chthoniobacterales bacterium]|jgi:hypothetical protein